MIACRHEETIQGRYNRIGFHSIILIWNLKLTTYIGR